MRRSLSAALGLARAALARLGGQIALAVEGHRDAEQPLNHALVDLAGQVDSVLELVGLLRLRGDDPRHGRQRRGLPQRPQQVDLGVVERWRREQTIGQDHADSPPRRHHRSAHEPHGLGEELEVVRGDLVGEVALDLDDAVLGQRASGELRGLDCHVGGGELLDSEAVGARRAHPPRCPVVAEDQRPAHSREPAHSLAQAVVEVAAGSIALLRLREHLDEQLQRLDSETGGRGPRRRWCSSRSRDQEGPASIRPIRSSCCGRQIDAPALLAARTPAFH